MKLFNKFNPKDVPSLNDGQFQALKDSLPKWQYLSYYSGADHEPLCECCSYALYGYGSCRRCPIYGITEERLCTNTPYLSWRPQYEFDGVLLEEGQDTAEEEYFFLEGIYSIELHRRLGYK